ncbi:MAG: protein phosphatase 2C domain-containing protein [Gammaproteobacteria bacterium]|nr:protein phosphatase 2C domain-containing protein [Gammaproteobacteria bacterium]
MGLISQVPLLYLGDNNGEQATHTFAGGTVCVYSCQSPDKTSGNEDSAGLIPCGQHAGVLAIADGMGGVAGGDKASQTAITELSKTVTTQCAPHTPLRDGILDGIEKANQKILDFGTGSATTLIAVEVNDGVVRSVHVGDSVALVTGQRGKIKYQTISHSPVGYALESGLIPEEEAMTHDERHIISNVVGSTEMRLEIGPQLELARHDTLLLGSDGLFDNLTIEEIIEIIRCGSLIDAAQTLSTLCQKRMTQTQEDSLCKPDDLTFILYRPE